MTDKYVFLADGKSPHTLKWVEEIKNYFDVYLISLNGISEKLANLLEEKKIFILNDTVKFEGGNYKLLLQVGKISNILKSIKPKFINAHYLSSYGFLAALTKPQSSILIQSTWGTDILVQPFENKIRHKIAEFSLKKADLITSDSFYMTDVIKGFGIEENKILTFTFGLKQVSLHKGKKENIIFSNRSLERNYNIDKIIKWFSKQPNKYKLVIANDGSERKNLETLVKKLNLENRVSFVGFLDSFEQEKYYKISKFYISIPSSDSTSVSLLEAMSFGAIPIVSNIPANREWIIDGINGIFFKEDLLIDNIDIYEDYKKINYKLIKNKAIFSVNISKFIENIYEIEIKKRKGKRK